MKQSDDIVVCLTNGLNAPEATAAKIVEVVRELWPEIERVRAMKEER